MIKNLILLLGAALLLTAIFLPAQAAEGDITFAGQVSYRERIALPAHSQLRITLVDLDNGGRAILGATSTIGPHGQVPLQFELNVRSNVLRATGRYGLTAEIIAGGAVQFRNPDPVLVPAGGSPMVGILLNFDPQPAETTPAATLLDTIWDVRTIAGNPVLAATSPSLSIAADRRAGGNSGCNNYFTEAMIDGQALSFGPVAGTRMACASDVMVQEAGFFAALEQVRSFALAADTLRLLDEAGNDVIGLVRGQ